MWLADFDFQTSGWIFSVSLYPNESTESVTSRFPPKMGNSSTPNSRYFKLQQWFLTPLVRPTDFSFSFSNRPWVLVRDGQSRGICKCSIITQFDISIIPSTKCVKKLSGSYRKENLSFSILINRLWPVIYDWFVQHSPTIHYFQQKTCS